MSQKKDIHVEGTSKADASSITNIDETVERKFVPTGELVKDLYFCGCTPKPKTQNEGRRNN